MKKMIRGKGLPRLCKRCGERFRPNSRGNKICNKCKEISKWQRLKK